LQIARPDCELQNDCLGGVKSVTPIPRQSVATINSGINGSRY
jgi:hypothetical protein